MESKKKVLEERILQEEQDFRKSIISSSHFNHTLKEIKNQIFTNFEMELDHYSIRAVFEQLVKSKDVIAGKNMEMCCISDTKMKTIKQFFINFKTTKTQILSLGFYYSNQFEKFSIFRQDLLRTIT